MPVKSKVEILQNFVAFSEYMNFTGPNLVSYNKNIYHLILLYKVHIFWEGYKILQNLHLTFDWHYLGQE